MSDVNQTQPHYSPGSTTPTSMSRSDAQITAMRQSKKGQLLQDDCTAQFKHGFLKIFKNNKSITYSLLKHEQLIEGAWIII